MGQKFCSDINIINNELDEVDLEFVLQKTQEKKVLVHTIMDTEEFRTRGKEMVDYMCDYMNTIDNRRVTPDLKPGYLKPLLPPEAPQMPESFDEIMRDFNNKIMPGITHWNHPRFHAYFPSGNSYPSILAGMLSDVIACIGFSWAASPACTELETIVMDWFGKAIGLPEGFLSHRTGGGVIQTSASECVLVCMLAARAAALNYLKDENETEEEAARFLPKLVAYCSKEAHSCVEKAAKICLVQLKVLEPDNNNSLRGEIIRKAIQEDKDQGLHPFFVLGVLGSTGSCSFDNILEMGNVLRNHPEIWFHIDAAYAGNAFICPEFRPLMAGIDYAHSFNTNPNKWLLVNYDCSCLWVQDRIKLMAGLVVDPLYLKHEHEDDTLDYRHWQIPLSRRFRSLKLWFVFRNYGISGLQSYIRNHVKLAQRFENHILKDKRFEVLNDVRMGLVCFRLRATADRVNQDLLAEINHSGKLHMVPSCIKGKYILRFCVNYQHATEDDIDTAWGIIQRFAEDIIAVTSPRILRIPSTPEGRKLQRQFSFTRSVSRSIYHRSMSRSSLYDGATPIIVPDEDDDETNVFEDVFLKATIKEEDSIHKNGEEDIEQ
uniref:Tyrosine decarboxylase n=1 Tax=Clastoptera arizonana TaxID=38151 RepID=A0A1B6E7B5_9HEMI